MADKPFPSSEYKLLAELSKVLGSFAEPGGAYPLTLGDDAAIRCSQGEGERLVITTDTAVENVHFKTDYMTLAEIGFRIMAANVSDCAAMAARPEAALVNLVFPAIANDEVTPAAVELYKGFAEACRRWNFKIIGGDLARGTCWTVGITMIGRAPQNGRLLKRKGIFDGDRLWAAGFPGSSAAGLAALAHWGRKNVPSQFWKLVLRHVAPNPDVELGIRMGACPEIHAMMDLSDGISKDARTLCYDNDLGLFTDLEKLTPPLDMAVLGQELGIDPADWILHGGEEYTLLFAASPEFDPKKTFNSASIVEAGRFSSSHRSIMVKKADGVVEEVKAGSWDHLK